MGRWDRRDGDAETRIWRAMLVGEKLGINPFDYLQQTNPRDPENPLEEEMERA